MLDLLRRYFKANKIDFFQISWIALTVLLSSQTFFPLGFGREVRVAYGLAYEELLPFGWRHPFGRRAGQWGAAFFYQAKRKTKDTDLHQSRINAYVGQYCTGKFINSKRRLSRITQRWSRVFLYYSLQELEPKQQIHVHLHYPFITMAGAIETCCNATK